MHANGALMRLRVQGVGLDHDAPDSSHVVDQNVCGHHHVLALHVRQPCNPVFSTPSLRSDCRKGAFRAPKPPNSEMIAWDLPSQFVEFEKSSVRDETVKRVAGWERKHPRQQQILLGECAGL
eukprot:3308440-Rhodomonas_salina.4